MAVFNDADINDIKNNILDLEISGNVMEIDYNSQYINISKEIYSNYWGVLSNCLYYIFIFRNSLNCWISWYNYNWVDSIQEI